MLKLSEVTDKLKEEFYNDIGYKQCNSLFDRNSPYYDKDECPISTKDSTCCELYFAKDGWRVEFMFRNIDDDHAVKWCEKFLEKYDIQYHYTEIHYHEKGWFAVYAYISKRSICERYGLYDKYLEAIDSNAAET